MDGGDDDEDGDPGDGEEKKKGSMEMMMEKKNTSWKEHWCMMKLVAREMLLLKVTIFPVYETPMLVSIEEKMMLTLMSKGM